jgi:hypothetical protein
MRRPLPAPAIPLLLLFMVSSCAVLSTEDWPNLGEGFESRDEIASGSTDTAGLSGTPQPDEAAVTSGEIDPVVEAEMDQLAAEFALIVDNLALQHQRFIAARQALQAAADDEAERRWFTTQLELSRLHAIGDEIADLEKRITTARALGPTSNGASLYAELQALKRRALTFQNEERAIIDGLTPEAYRRR